MKDRERYFHYVTKLRKLKVDKGEREKKGQPLKKS
jgi:hypothetical protein